jgi:hypothetical protein
MRLLPTAAVGLLAVAGVASAMTPLVRTLDEARGRGSVTVAARTGSLHTEMWIARTGGKGLAHVSGGVSCETRTSSGTSAEDEAFGFSLPPSSRHVLWRHVPHSGNCVISVSVTVRGRGVLRVALRGY